MSNQKDNSNEKSNPNAWLGITSKENATSAFEYVCSLEDRQLSGGLILGAVDRRPKDKKWGLGACGSNDFTPYN